MRGHAPASSAAISAWRKRHGYPPVRQTTPKRELLIPWKVATKDSRHRYYCCLLLLTRVRAGLNVSDKDRARLEKFVRELSEADAVIHYDRVNGWRAVKPRAAIDIDMIRDPRRDDLGNLIEFDPCS